MIGSDVVALFASIKSRNIGIIVRRRVEKTSMKFPGFNTRHGLRYIKMKMKHLTGDLTGIRHLLPMRRKFKGVAPGMTGKAVNDRKE